MKFDFNTISKKINPLLLLFVCLGLLPFVLISFYIHPHYDDYDFVNKLIGKNVFECTAYWYNTWSGRYSTIFLTNVFTYGTNNITIYRLYPLLLMTLYVASFYTLFKTLFGTLFSRSKLVFFSLFFLVLYIYKMPEVTTGFYYMICSYVSSAGTVALIFLLSVFLKLLQPGVKNKIPLLVAGALLAIFIGGSYEPTMILSIMFVFLTGIILMIKKDPNFKWIVFIGIVLVACTYLSISAPGNKVRGGEDILQAHHVNILEVFFKAISYGCNLVLNTIQNPLLILSLLLFIPLAIKLNAANIVVRTVLNLHPILPVIGIFVIASVSFLPSMWANNAPPRVANQVYLFIIINLFFCIQVFVNRCIKNGIELNLDKNYYIILKVIIIICLVPSLSNKNIGRAYSDLVSKAPSYNKQLYNRYEYIRSEKAAGKTSIVIPQLFNEAKKYPLTIFYNSQELETNANSAVNKLYAKYWGLDSVRVEERKVIDFITTSRVN